MHRINMVMRTRDAAQINDLIRLTMGLKGILDSDIEFEYEVAYDPKEDLEDEPSEPPF